MTNINGDQPRFIPHKDNVSLKHTSVLVMSVSITTTEIKIPNFARHLIQCSHTYTMWITKDFIKLVMWSRQQRNHGFCWIQSLGSKRAFIPHFLDKP